MSLESRLETSQPCDPCTLSFPLRLLDKEKKPAGPGAPANLDLIETTMFFFSRGLSAWPPRPQGPRCVLPLRPLSTWKRWLQSPLAASFGASWV